jgi:CDGSH-type Zn-finger protein
MADVTIKISLNGPYVIEGEVNLVDHEGNPVATRPGKKISLCRCGASVTKPFCDGTHSRIGFVAAEQAAKSFDESSGV